LLPSLLSGREHQRRCGRESWHHGGSTGEDESWHPSRPADDGPNPSLRSGEGAAESLTHCGGLAAAEGNRYFHYNLPKLISMVFHHYRSINCANNNISFQLSTSKPPNISNFAFFVMHVKEHSRKVAAVDNEQIGRNALMPQS
jgi:hypothetical protein